MTPLGRTLAIIPARSGSKGLVDKNIKKLAGRPLMAWTIEAALKSSRVDSVIVSTDDSRYADIAKSYGAEAPFLRPSSIAGDDASLMSVLTQVRDSEFARDIDTIVCLQPTSPLRTHEHIDSALAQFEQIEKPDKSMASVYEVPAKYRWLLQTAASGALSFVDDSLNETHTYARQNNSPVYMPNGAIFIYQADKLSKQYTEQTFPFVMSKEASIDIDTQEDFEAAKQLIARTSR